MAKYTEEALKQVQEAKEKAVFKSYQSSEEDYQRAAEATALAQAKKAAGVYDSAESAIQSVIGKQEPEPISYTIPAISAGIGFLIGALTTFLFFRIQIKKIRTEYNIRLTEARESLDRVLKIAARE
jgi:hypothetical protein